MLVENSLEIIKQKEKAYKLKGFLEKSKKFAKNKKSYNKLIKVINDFINCNITDKSIYTKYEYMRTTIEWLQLDK